MKQLGKKSGLRSAFVQARKAARKNWSDIEHRLETVAMVDDVEYINDSKATDIESTCYSMEQMEQPVIWLAGSAELEQDYELLSKMVKYKVTAIVVFGERDTDISKSLAHLVEDYARVDSLETAMDRARALSNPGHCVLMSPASPSFEMFENYKQRGDLFREIVINWKS